MSLVAELVVMMKQHVFRQTDRGHEDLYHRTGRCWATFLQDKLSTSFLRPTGRNLTGASQVRKQKKKKPPYGHHQQAGCMGWGK